MEKDQTSPPQSVAAARQRSTGDKTTITEETVTEETVMEEMVTAIGSATGLAIGSAIGLAIGSATEIGLVAITTAVVTPPTPPPTAPTVVMKNLLPLFLAFLPMPKTWTPAVSAQARPPWIQ